MMKKSSLIILILLFFLNFEVNAKINNKILVTVDDLAITSMDLINEIKLTNIISGGKLSKLKKNEIKEYAIKSLINKSVKENEINKYKLPEVSISDINSEIKKINKKLNISEENFREILNEQQIPYELLNKKIITDFKWNYLIFKLYKNKISINENEIIFQINLLKKKKFINEYNLSEILLNPISADQIDLEMSKVINKIDKNGFEQTALELSISNSATDNGNLGWIEETKISKKILQTIDKLPVGSITKPIPVVGGIMLIKINDKKSTKNIIDMEKAKKSIVANMTNKKLDFFSILHFQKIKNIANISFY